MHQINIKKYTRWLPAVALTLLLVLSAVFLWVGGRNSSQSETPIIAGISMNGEYKLGNGEWQPITGETRIPATKGDVTLRGYFQMHNPTTGEAIGPVPAGTTIHLYFNHIAGTLYLSNGSRIPFDAENAVLGEDACAVMWSSFTVTDSNTVTLLLHNPHAFGNENAVNEFLQNMSLAPSSLHESMMLERGEDERNIGLLILITALIILGIAAFSTVIHIKYSKKLWLIGLSSFFAGGYFLFDAFSVCFWNDSNIINTRALGLCMMLYMQFTAVLITSMLKKKRRRIACAATLFSGFTVLLCVAVSFSTDIKFFDTFLWWAIVEGAVTLTLILCQAFSFRGTTASEKLLFGMGIAALAAFPIDFLATALGWWAGGSLSKHVFLVVFIMMLIAVLRIIPAHINAAIKAQELENEQQALQLQLQESRISIMLSQMQPHFIFNTLNTIYHLCEIDPAAARSTISSFSEYLRNNIDNLGQSDMISFEKELSFVKTYLDIEKVRFDDELEITYDITTTDFSLPVLTVEPIVENAVKHGTSKKKGVASLHISTAQTDTCYEIVIRDTGVGFDPNAYQSDGHKHVGIANVRQRLENLCGGTLSIESTAGVGTTATIRIPKKEHNA